MISGMAAQELTRGFPRQILHEVDIWNAKFGPKKHECHAFHQQDR